MFWPVLRSEWTKLRSVRSTWWLVVVALTLTVAIGRSGQRVRPVSRVRPRFRLNVAMRSVLGAILAQLALDTLAVLVISGEYGSGMIRTSMTVVPRRLPVLAAKITVYVAAVLPMTVLTIGRHVPARPGGLAVPGASRVRRSVTRPSPGSCSAPPCTSPSRESAPSRSGPCYAAPPGHHCGRRIVLRGPDRHPGDAESDLRRGSLPALQCRRPAVPHRDLVAQLPPWPGFALLCGYAAVLVAAAAWRLRRADV
jgi:hypothetical protein